MEVNQIVTLLLALFWSQPPPEGNIPLYLPAVSGNNTDDCDESETKE